MPYLRFSRDKRGYENTYVFHGTRSDGKSRPRMLYWFRTPPNVKVGRLSLDESAIRAIEENNPDLSFDWGKMLKVRGTPPPRQAGQGAPRRSQRRGRRAPGEGRPPAAMPPTPYPPEGLAADPVLDAIGVATPPLSDLATERESELPTGGPIDVDEVVAEAHLDTRAETEAMPLGPESDEHPVVVLMGHETLARLRARYAEIQARIAEKPLQPDLADAIRAQAASLNPDRWTQIEDAVAGIERFEANVEAVKAKLGRRPPRHRRGDNPSRGE